MCSGIPRTTMLNLVVESKDLGEEGGWPVNERSYWRRVTDGLLGQLGCGRSRSCSILAVDFSNRTVDGEKIRRQFFNRCFERFYFFLLLRKRTVDTLERIAGRCYLFECQFRETRATTMHPGAAEAVTKHGVLSSRLRGRIFHHVIAHGTDAFSVCRTFGRRLVNGRLANGTGHRTLHTRQDFRRHC